MPAVIELAARLLRPGGFLGIEHDQSHAEALAGLLNASGCWTTVTGRPDLTGRPRSSPAVRARRYGVTARVEAVAGRGLAHTDSWVAGQGLPARPIRHVWEAPVLFERTSVGLDVHARSVAAAAIDGVTGELLQARLTPVA